MATSIGDPEDSLQAAENTTRLKEMINRLQILCRKISLSFFSIDSIVYPALTIYCYSTYYYTILHDTTSLLYCDPSCCLLATLATVLHLPVPSLQPSLLPAYCHLILYIYASVLLIGH